MQWGEDDGDPPPGLSSQLRVGDLVHDEGGYRALESRAVRPDGSLPRIGDGGNGEGIITLEISRHIGHPVEFYADELEKAVCLIELDQELHALALKGVAIARAPDGPSGVVLWAYGEYDP